MGSWCSCRFHLRGLRCSATRSSPSCVPCQRHGIGDVRRRLWVGSPILLTRRVEIVRRRWHTVERPGARSDQPRSPNRQWQFGPPAPNRLWVADLTYVSTWSGFAHVAVVVDAYARRILGWRVASTMATSMVFDAIEQANWTRQQEGVMDLNDVVHHTDRGSQPRFNESSQHRLIEPILDAR
jgi:transposase InsO family protein